MSKSTPEELLELARAAGDPATILHVGRGGARSYLVGLIRRLVAEIERLNAAETTARREAL